MLLLVLRTNLAPRRNGSDCCGDEEGERALLVLLLLLGPLLSGMKAAVGGEEESGDFTPVEAVALAAAVTTETLSPLPAAGDGAPCSSSSLGREAETEGRLLR